MMRQKRIPRGLGAARRFAAGRDQIQRPARHDSTRPSIGAQQPARSDFDLTLDALDDTLLTSMAVHLGRIDARRRVTCRTRAAGGRRSPGNRRPTEFGSALVGYFRGMSTRRLATAG